MAIAGITGVFKMLLMIAGAFLFLRFLGQLLNAKRNMEEERYLNEQKRKLEKERFEKMKKFGKTTILKKSENKKVPSSYNDVVDVDFEEIN